MLTLTIPKVVPVEKVDEVMRLRQECSAARQKYEGLSSDWERDNRLVRIECGDATDEELLAARIRLNELETTSAVEKAKQEWDKSEKAVNEAVSVAKAALLDARKPQRRKLVRELFIQIERALQVANQVDDYDSETEAMGASEPHRWPARFLTESQVAEAKEAARQGDWLDQ